MGISTPSLITSNIPQGKAKAKAPSPTPAEESDDSMKMDIDLGTKGSDFDDDMERDDARRSGRRARLCGEAAQGKRARIRRREEVGAKLDAADESRGAVVRLPSGARCVGERDGSALG